MTIFQLIMLAAAAFFAYQVYVHIQNIDEDAEPESMQALDEMKAAMLAPGLDKEAQEADFNALIEEADKVYMDGDINKAKVMLEGIVKKFPSMAEGLNKLAFVLSKLGEEDEALLYYRASLRIDESDDMTHNAIARLLTSMKKYDEAEEHYQRALSIDAEYEITWFNYASLMLEMDEKTRAKEMFEKALTIDPDLEEAKEALKRLV